MLNNLTGFLFGFFLFWVLIAFLNCFTCHSGASLTLYNCLLAPSSLLSTLCRQHSSLFLPLLLSVNKLICIVAVRVGYAYLDFHFLFSFLGKQICPNKRTWYMILYMLYTYCMAYAILYCRGNPIRLQRTRITHQLQNENQNQTKSKYLFYWRLQVWSRRLELVNYGHNCRHPFAHCFSTSSLALLSLPFFILSPKF